ncbi:MAG: chitinase [Lachnospiraceae bacterium]|nr:chitinase [Lachnospiraceae bacterium]
MLAKAIPVVIAIVLIIALVGIFYGETLIESVYYTSEREDLYQYFELVESDDVAIMLQDAHIDEKAKLVDGNCYFDMATVEKYFTDRFYINRDEGIILYTTEKDIYKTFIGEEYSYYTISGAENPLSAPAAILVDEEIYLSAEFVKLFANFSYEFFEEPNRMLLYTEWGTRQSANIVKDTKLRYQGGVKSPILKDMSEGDKVYVLEEMEKWTKVISEDGLIGYIENKRLETGETVTQTPVTDAVVLNYQSISHEGKINMAFHQVFSAAANSTYDSYMADTKAVNVIAPTWFRVKDEEGTLECIASSDYITKAHNQGIEVWAVVTDVDYEVPIGAILSSSEKREAMVSALISYALQYGVDGINVDFETVGADYGDDFVQFLRELSIQTHANNLVLSVDNYAPTASTMYYNRAEQGLVADYVVIMGYDEHWASSQTAGSVASINFVETGIQRTMEEVPAEKIINAIPFYTRLWKTYGGAVSCETIGMDVAQNWIDSNGVELYWDNETCQYYGEIQKDGTLYQIWMEENESIQVKLNVMDANNIAGVAEWKLDFENPSVWDVIEAYVNS